MPLYGGIRITGKPDPENIRRLDLLPVKSLMEMSQYGIAIDIPYLHDLSRQMEGQIKELKSEICSYIPPVMLDEFTEKAGKLEDGLPMNVNSRDQLSDLMFDVLKIGAGKRLKTTKSGDRISTSKKQMELLKYEHPIVQKTLNYAEVHKLKSTYVDKLPTIARVHRVGSCWCGLKHHYQTSRIHSTFWTTVTSTGRLSSSNPNLQNIPARTELGRKIRAAFIPSGPTYRFVGADFSQIEMRLGGHRSKDANLLRIFKEKLDPHTDTAKRAFNVEKPDKMTQRDPCKNVNFGVFYGLSGPGLYDLMAVTYSTARLPMPDWLTVDWCSQFIEDWFNLYPGVRDYLQQQFYRARRYGIVWTMMGRVRRVPEVKSCHERIQAAGLRQAGNMPIQGDCADFNKLAIAEIQETIEMFRRENIHAYPQVTVHDEMICEVEEDYTELLKLRMEGIMCNVDVDRESGRHGLIVPVESDGKVMERWVK